MADRISELERQQCTASEPPASSAAATNSSAVAAVVANVATNSHRQTLHSHNHLHQHHQQQQPPPIAAHNNVAHSNGLIGVAQRFTFLDPSKTTRISNPALKAFQKNAVQSYFERQQLSQPREPMAAVTTRHSLGAATGRPQSMPISSSAKAQPPAGGLAAAPARSSLPSNYAAQMQPQPQSGSPAVNGAVTVTPPRSPAQSAHASPVLPKSNHGALQTAASPATLALSSPTYQAAYQQAAAQFSGAANCATLSFAEADATAGGGDQVSNAVCDDFMNESGVPPPPPRRNRSLMPVRR